MLAMGDSNEAKFVFLYIAFILGAAARYDLWTMFCDGSPGSDTSASNVEDRSSRSVNMNPIISAGKHERAGRRNLG